MRKVVLLSPQSKNIFLGETSQLSDTTPEMLACLSAHSPRASAENKKNLQH